LARIVRAFDIGCSDAGITVPATELHSLFQLVFTRSVHRDVALQTFPLPSGFSKIVIVL